MTPSESYAFGRQCRRRNIPLTAIVGRVLNCYKVSGIVKIFIDGWNEQDSDLAVEMS